MQKAMAAFIPAGTVLYFDASRAWSAESAIEACFIVDNPADEQCIAMTPVPGENHIWQATAPSPGPWTYVVFRTATGL